MDQHSQDDLASSLAQARKTIEQQAQEIEQLRQQHAREHFAQELRHLLIASSTANALLSPTTHEALLEIVVQTATQVISARAGSLFLIDHHAQDLVFKVAVGPAAQEVKKFRVPLGHGIAGLVAASGHPMALTNAHQDGRLAIDIASAINYIPESILCVPLFYEDRVIGALELLDKLGSNAAFDVADMHILGLFANIAAVAISQSQAYHDQQAILNTLLRSFQQNDPQRRQALYQQAITFSEWMETEDTTFARARELVQLVQECISFGDSDQIMCIHILQSLVENSRNRNKAFAVTTK